MNAFVRKTLTLILAGLSLAGWTAARAAPVTYDWTGGSVTLSATDTNGTNYLAAGASIPLTSASQVTFDSTAMTIPSFEFADLGPSSLTLAGPLAGDTLTLSNLAVEPPASGYSSSATGTNPYNFTLGPIDATGSYVVTNAADITLASGSFNHANPTLSGQITLGGANSDALTLNGITLGAISVAGTQIIMKGDVTFDGAAVPLPASLWLFGSGLAMLSAGRFLRRRRPGVTAALILALVLGFGLLPKTSRASIITLDVNGGYGLDQGDLCATTSGQTCPTDPTYTLSGSAAVSGSFTYNTVSELASFTLTLTRNADFGGEQMLAGSSFSGSGVSVQLTQLNATTQEITQIGGPVNGVASNVTFNPGLATIQGAPAISGLSCTIGSGTDVCGVSLGAGGLEFGPDANGISYNSFLTFNVNALPVPLPGAGWLLLTGIVGFAGWTRRRVLVPA